MPIRDIYGGIEIRRDNISIDHFVPWSYVAHDELWNLSPTVRSINSSKGNHLPAWDVYFSRLAEFEFSAYETVYSITGLSGVYRKCVEEHVNSQDVMRKLYVPGLDKEKYCNALESVVRPVYDAAANMGFDAWIYENG